MDINFSFTDLFKYWDTLTQYINPIHIVVWGILGGVAGFVIVLIVEIILRKKILVHRRHWSLKYLSYLYMAFFPLFAGFSFTQWFALHNCEKQFVANVPTILGSGNDLFNQYLKSEVEKIVEARHLEMTGNEAFDKTISIAGSALGEMLQENGMSDSELEALAMKYLVESDMVKDKAVSYFSSTVGESLLMDEKMVKELLDVQLNNLLDNGVMNTVLEKHIRNISRGLKMNVFLIFLIGISLPVIEIILANYLERKRRKEVLSSINSLEDRLQ